VTATATATADTAVPARTTAEIRRSRYLGVTYLFLAALVLFLFARWSRGLGNFTFSLARASDPSMPDLTLSTGRVTLYVGLALLVLGGYQLARGFGRRDNLVLALGIVLFLFAFLAWATGQSVLGSFSLVGMLKATIVRSAPITLGALAGVMSERVAVINIAIEGQLLGGAFVGSVVASPLTHQGDRLILGAPIGGWIGVLAAILAGMLLAWVLAVLAIRYVVDQIIAGVVITIFVGGLTSFLSLRWLAENQGLNQAPIFKSLGIPLLSRIPLLGPIFFDHNIFVFGSFVLVALLTFLLFRTRWGLRARAVGEHPKAADTVGVNVYRTRYLNVILGGAIAGFGGAFFTLGSVGRFDENMTNGRGFIGLAAMIFGRWHPVGAMAAALVFGFADALSQTLGILQTGIPSEFLGMAPFIATILVVAGLVGRAKPPAADGQPYIKE
jgi:general nucleoside transport system permease protein